MSKKVKKRSKKYNPNRIGPVAAAASLKMNKLGVWSTCDVEHAKVLSMKTKTVFNPDATTAAMIANYPHFWHYTMVIFCRDQNKQNYLITGEPHLPDENGVALSARRLDQAKLAESLNEAHKEFLKEAVNPLHVVNTGWVAFPYKAEIDEETIAKIADGLGVWEHLSKWEAQVKEATAKRKQEVSDIDSIKTRSVPQLGSKK